MGIGDKQWWGKGEHLVTVYGAGQLRTLMWHQNSSEIWLLTQSTALCGLPVFQDLGREQGRQDPFNHGLWFTGVTDNQRFTIMRAQL